jgi:hypothetical protein
MVFCCCLSATASRRVRQHSCLLAAAGAAWHLPKANEMPLRLFDGCVAGLRLCRELSIPGRRPFLVVSI